MTATDKATKMSMSRPQIKIKMKNMTSVYKRA